ncbi:MULTISPECIES: hypothetical protein [Nostocales]|uniref:hypothetical protein n=1 Tax=Nostocales TaxID=1161 RepID=UPI001687F16A|nr:MULTISPECIES: hypothetical protein [Nostocales]MBD2301922.1 hypothetical protein [Nostoc sp. FACHB-190]MBD2491521.1 hypothetical protein [Aulosira sp. FACHB-615]
MYKSLRSKKWFCAWRSLSSTIKIRWFYGRRSLSSTIKIRWFYGRRSLFVDRIK